MESFENPMLQEMLECLDAGDYEAALQLLQRQDPDQLTDDERAGFVAIMVVCFYAMDMNESAEGTLAEVLGQDSDPEFAFVVGEWLLELEEYEGAEYVYERLSQITPKDADAWGNLGFVHETVGQYDEGLAAYKTAARLKPDDPDHYRGQGICLEGLGKLPEAVRAHQRYCELAPTDPEGWISLGTVQRAEQDYPGAKDSFGHADRLDPASTKLHFLWAITAAECDDRDQLEHSLAVLQENSPGDWSTVAVEGLVSEKTGEISRGWECVIEAFELAAAEPTEALAPLAAEFVMSYAWRNDLQSELEAFAPRILEEAAFTDSVLAGLRRLSGPFCADAADFAVLLQGDVRDEGVIATLTEEDEYGPPYRFVRVLRVLAQSPKQAQQMAIDFEQRCQAVEVVSHHVKPAPWKGGGHLGVWQYGPAEYFSAHAPGFEED